MRDVLHWLPVSQRILYRVSALVWHSATGCAPSYLTDLCRPVSDLASRRALRSSACGELLVPQARSAIKQRQAFSVSGPSTWNELHSTLRLLPLNEWMIVYLAKSSWSFILETYIASHQETTTQRRSLWRIVQSLYCHLPLLDRKSSWTAWT